jgi:D-alanine transfer protein
MSTRATAADHLWAAGIVVLIGLFAGPSLLRWNPFAKREIHAKPASALTWPLAGYEPTYADEPYLASLLGQCLKNGSSLVLFGSSELTTAAHPAKPTLFFPNELKVPLLAVGHEGNQSFSIHAQLIAADAPLDQARLAILVSPGWFGGNSARRGTALEAFLEYQPTPSFYRVYRRLQRRDVQAVPYTDYLLDHERELTGAQPIVQLMTQEAGAGVRLLHWFNLPWVRYRADLVADTMLEVPKLSGKDRGPWSMPQFTPEEWADRYRSGIADQMKLCTNNSLYVNDAYYSTYLQHGLKEVHPVPFAENRELRDLASLLDFLEHEKAQPFFIIQPLNPYAYSNLPEMTPTMDSVRNMIAQHGFKFLDMWTDDTARYTPGTLTDVQHLGPLGWYRVDSALTTYFK